MNYIVQLFCIIGMSGCLLADTDCTDQELFDAAHTQVQQGSYDQALATFKQMRSKDAATYLSMADVAQKKGHVGVELAYLCKAFQRCPLLSYRLRSVVANRLSELRHTINPKRSLAQKMQEKLGGFVRTLPMLWLQIIFLLLWGGLFIVFPRWHGAHGKKIKIYGLCICMLAGMLVSRVVLQSRRHAVVRAADTSVYSGPGATYHFVQALPAGREVRIEARNEDFCKISVQGRVSGWVAKKDLKSV